MKILYHHRTRAEDAQGIHIAEMTKAFERLGHHVDLVGIISHSKKGDTSIEESLISKIASKAPAIVYEFMEILYNVYGFYKLRQQIKKTKPDFIYERYALFNLSGLLVSKIYGIPLIEEVNAPLSKEKSLHAKLVLKSFASWCEKIICSHSHKTIVVSTPLKRIMMESGVPSKKMVVIPNGIDEHYFNPHVDGCKIREKYKLKNKIVIGFVGWFRQWHGLEELLETYAAQDMINKNIHILLVGDGPAFDALMEITKKHNILDKGVSFTGPVPRENIPEHIAAFDLALQPDVTDYASPIKLFEYISMGKGVIAPDKENIVEILSKDYPGLFKAGDWKNMGDVILKTASSQDRVKEMGEIVFSIFKDKQYFWGNNAEKTLNLINK